MRATKPLLALLGLLAPLLLAFGSPAPPTAPLRQDVCLDESALPASLATHGRASSTTQTTTSAANMPVFFFHGLTGNGSEGFNLEANLTAEGRVFVALRFCEKECSRQALNNQIPMAIAAVRDVVSRDERFANGYVFIGHSQGGVLARAVIEEMDDHNVHTFVSLAGAQNGVFFGPQLADSAPLGVLTDGFGAEVLPPSAFDFSTYTASEQRGKMQHEYALRSMDAGLQAAYAMLNLGRTPVRDAWLDTNVFLPTINNVKACSWYDFGCVLHKRRRKANFLKLKAVHLFASPNDAVVSPWQISHFGHYSEVTSMEEIESDFEGLTMVEMHDTVEYLEDTFGLRSLDERGSLFRHEAPGIPHCCWLYDSPQINTEGLCKFHPVYDKYVYPVIA